MSSHLRTVVIATLAWGLATACQPKAGSESTTPVDDTSSLGPCEPKFQATRAYVSFGNDPNRQAFDLGALAAEEIISSLRATGCEPRPDLPDHAAMVDALRNGALMVSAITFIGELPDAAEVVASEASFGDATAPDARSFALRVHRAHSFTPPEVQGAEEPIVATWRITGVSLR